MLQIVVRFIDDTPWRLEAKAEGLKCETFWNERVWIGGNFEACARAWLKGRGYDETVELAKGTFRENSPFGDIYVFIPKELIRKEH